MQWKNNIMKKFRYKFCYLSFIVIGFVAIIAIIISTMYRPNNQLIMSKKVVDSGILIGQNVSVCSQYWSTEVSYFSSAYPELNLIAYHAGYEYSKFIFYDRKDYFVLIYYDKNKVIQKVEMVQLIL